MLRLIVSSCLILSCLVLSYLVLIVLTGDRDGLVGLHLCVGLEVDPPAGQGEGRRARRHGQGQRARLLVAETTPA